ncbi:branched-chain amino acid transaminase [Candidatus Microgenomates bacterium]|nr:branched-chain amino acid transaminase [Candidatus Microgenomates bacterium]
MKQQYFPYAFFQGKLIPVKEAKVSIMTNALQYGTGLFGGIRGYLAEDGKGINIFRLSDHYQRFLQSMLIIDRKLKYSHQELVSITLALVKKNQPKTDCYLRPIAYAANLGISPDLSVADFDFAIYMIPLGEYLSLDKGLKLMVSSWVRISDNMIPARAKITGGYINSALAKAEAARGGYDDALMLTSSGHVAEGSAANLFIVRNGALITSEKTADVLEGITRRSIIKLAEDLGIPVEERAIDRTEIYVADEAFLSGTGVQVAWIREVDGRVIGDGKLGPISEKIKQKFFDIVRGREKKYSGWLTKIY